MIVEKQTRRFRRDAPDVLLIGEMLEHAARTSPRQIAATLDDDALTFAELNERANRVANGLHGLRIGRGDRVLWWGDTSLEAVVVFAALAKLGAVFAPLNARAAIEECVPVAQYARPRLLLAGSSHLDAALELASAADVAFEPSIPEGAPDAPPRVALDDRDPHVIFFTSGSTGRPKGVVLSHRANWLRTYPGATTTAGGAGTVCMFPLFHMAGWTLAMGAWQGRRAVHLVRTPDPEMLLRTVERHRASRLYCIPAVWARVLAYGVDRHDVSTLHEADTGTSATPPELLAAIKDALPGTVTRVFYGSTEAGPGLQLGNDDLFRKPGSVGVPQPGVDVRLAGDGEICMRSTFLMDGYFDDPGATAEALRDGWYHTGDLGARDDEGYFSIVGRARDVIRSGGETIAPVEVERVLASHPAVAEVAVVGVPDARWGEIVTAVVVIVPGAATVTVENVRAFCEPHLAGFKHPRRVEIVDALPRTAATGQVQRTLIVERLLSA